MWHTSRLNHYRNDKKLAKNKNQIKAQIKLN